MKGDKPQFRREKGGGGGNDLPGKWKQTAGTGQRPGAGADGRSWIKVWRGSAFVYIQNFCALIYKKLPCQAVYPPFWQEIIHMQIYLPAIYKISRNRVYTRHIFLHMENEQVLQAVWRADPAVFRRNWIRSGNYFLYVNFGWVSAGPEFRGTGEAPQGTMNIE